MKNLLIIGYVWPEPNSSAAGSRMLDLIRAFQTDDCKVTFASAAALSPHRFKLEEIGVFEKKIELNCSSFDQFLNELQPDMVVFDRFFTEEQFGWRLEKSCPRAVKVLDTEDLHCLRYTRQRLLKEKQKQLATETEKYTLPPVVMPMADLHHEMLQDEICLRELAAIYRCDLSLIISRFEMELLTDYFHIPEYLLVYCPYLSLTEPSLLASPSYDERKDFLFLGNFRHEPNWDAVLWLKYQLWPKMRAQLPGVNLYIGGAYPPPKATQLHNAKEGFLVAGWIENAVQATQAARISLAPLRFGAGLKGKLFESMQSGTPSVTTSIGAEGIASVADWPGVVADDADDFVDAAVELYRDRNVWCEQQQKILPTLMSFTSARNLKWKERADAFLGSIEQHRSKNVIGKLLGYELHQAHKYMGLWIESKNKTSI